MKIKIWYITLFLFLFSACTDNSSNEKEKENKGVEIKKGLETDTVATVKHDGSDFKVISNKTESETINGVYYEYYPGEEKRIKLQGNKNEEGKRDGVWLFYSKEGKELSMTTYKNGVRDGEIMVKYPNGNIHYTGQYTNGERTGKWSFYSPGGKKIKIIDYDKK